MWTSFWEGILLTGLRFAADVEMPPFLACLTQRARVEIGKREPPAHLGLAQTPLYDHFCHFLFELLGEHASWNLFHL